MHSDESTHLPARPTRQPETDGRGFRALAPGALRLLLVPEPLYAAARLPQTVSRHEKGPPEPYHPPAAELPYDDRCRACNILAGAVEGLDARRQIKRVGFSQLEEGGTDLMREGLGSSLHVVREGVLLTGGDGVLAIAAILIPPFAMLERYQTVRRVFRRLYRVIADVIHE